MRENRKRCFVPMSLLEIRLSVEVQEPKKRGDLRFLNFQGPEEMKWKYRVLRQILRNQLVELPYQVEMKHPKWFEKSRFRDWSSRQAFSLNGDIIWVLPISERIRYSNDSAFSHSCSFGSFPHTSSQAMMINTTIWALVSHDIHSPLNIANRNGLHYTVISRPTPFF